MHNLSDILQLFSTPTRLLSYHVSENQVLQ